MGLYAYRLAAAGAVFLLWSLFVWTKGAGYTQDKWDSQVLKEEKRSTENVVRLARAASELDAVWIQTTAVVREKIKEIEKKVPVYVSEKANSKCDIPVGFIRLWDEPLYEAITPTSPIFSNDDPSGVALSRVATSGVLEAKERFEVNRFTLVSCQSYIRKVQEIFNNAP